ncbi:MAG: hypothetical protein NVSMB25_19630 [Thermoleophilaceae bacterium]
MSSAETADRATAVLLLGHGASGTSASMAPWVRALETVGVDTAALDLPRGRAERAVPAYRAALERHPRAAIGGHSFGGRVASLLAAEQLVSGLVLLSYPLHRPGHHEQLRSEHWPQIAAPVLMLCGDRDPFARLDLLRAEVAKLADCELVTYPRTGHGLLAHAGDASERIAAFMERIR